MKVANIITALPLAGALTTIAGQVSAQQFGDFNQGNNEILDSTCSLGNTIVRWAANIGLILAVMGLVWIAIRALFGKWDTQGLITNLGGLFLLASTGMIVKFFTNGNGTNCGDQSGGFGALG